MTTSLLFALAFTLPAPEWQTDYAQALKFAGEANKPLAVFIGTGPEGYKAILGDATQAQQILADKYICLYIDATQPANQATAASFRATGPTLILSDKTRAYQAYRASGLIPAEQLGSVLNQYADYQVPASGDMTRSSYYQPQGAPVGTAPPAGPGMGVAPGVAPGMCGPGGCGGHMAAPMHHHHQCAPCWNHCGNGCGGCGKVRHHRMRGCRSRGCGGCW
jgi:hypothetical protein